MHFRASWAVVEQQVLELLDLRVQRLHCVEMAVDHNVDESPQQEPHAVLREVGVVVPPLHHWFRIKLAGLANRDEVTL